MTDAPVAGLIQKSFKRQRRLLALFTVIFALWVVAMLVMYFTTVYPQRHHTASQISNTAQGVR